MRDPEWVSLTDAERGQLVAMWLLAADRGGVIPASPDIIQKLCFMETIPNLNKFTDLGFIETERRQGGVKVASTGSRDDQPKAEAETEKSREEKKEGKRKNFSPPSLEDLTIYCRERQNNIKPETFIDFYTAKNWMIGKNKMKDWKAAVRTWEQRDTGEKHEDPYANAL